METELHRQLKTHYGAEGIHEVRAGRYRFDAVTADRLIEIQCGPLLAIRAKIKSLLRRPPKSGPTHLLLVKPLVCRKMIIRRPAEGGPAVSRRASPKRESVYDLFEELVHIRGLFPHPRLTVEAVLVEVEEERGLVGVRRGRRGRLKIPVLRRSLTRIVGSRSLSTIADLTGLLPEPLMEPFTTGDLAGGCGIPRPRARQMAYCLRHAGAIAPVGRTRAGWLYKRNAA